MTDDITVLEGDMRDVLARLIAEGVTVQSVVTDPPYHLTSIVKRFGAANAAPAKAGRERRIDAAGKAAVEREPPKLPRGDRARLKTSKHGPVATTIRGRG